ncbi:MAG: 3-phosphoshikimate 1-carboxyvinyltransferase [Trueperaceae bacterium]|nr:3-phosphoshikimate 1-carboxyvinyltransferase [Trueperaceae bacterium]
MLSYPDQLEIVPKRVVDARRSVPGSKSLTNRAFVVAALATGRSVLHDVLIAEDSEVMIGALRQLDFSVTLTGITATVEGRAGAIPADAATLDLRLSGTSIRFLTALVALGRGDYRLDGTARMRERPIGDLLAALSELGASVGTELGNDCPPVIVRADGLGGGAATIAGGRSSQYLSALLMAAPYARNPVTLRVEGVLQSKPFIDMTIELMRDFGVDVVREGYERFEIAPGVYQAREYAVEGDAMAAGYLWAAAAVTGGRVTVTNLGEGSSQGDKRLADVLGSMGCSVGWSEHEVAVAAPADGVLRGGRFDLNDMPDQAQTLAVVALFADRPVRIDNIWNLRIKETDRLRALATELRKFGTEVTEGDDYIVVNPLETPPPGRVIVDSYGDHRMAMAFALAGLRLPGVVIDNPACVAKTFPDFFRVLADL